MSANKNQPHIYVLPEDDADSQLAVEFLAEVPWNRQRQMKVLTPAGGWRRVLEHFTEVHVPEMNRCPARFMVLLIDFDNQYEARRQQVQETIPTDLANRVFVLGALNEPEDLKPVLGSYSKIGSKLARDCHDGTDGTWGHALLQHNADELDRARQALCSILFPPT